MIGTGTYPNEYRNQFRFRLKDHRAWLDQLLLNIAEKISYKNAARLFAGQSLSFDKIR